MAQGAQEPPSIPPFPPGEAGSAAGSRSRTPPAGPGRPFLRAPEASRSIFLTIFAAACLPLAAGVFFFGFRALLIAAVSVAVSLATETVCYRVTRTPSLLGRTHAALTGLLLALTLPPWVGWYVPAVGAVFAVIVGKAVFGGVGHFLWQPALVGRLAVTVIFAPPLWPGAELNRPAWPVLTPDRVLVGDVLRARPGEPGLAWRNTRSDGSSDALAMPPPRELLRELTAEGPESDIWRSAAQRAARPESIASVLVKMPPAWDLCVGAYGGPIGATSAIVVLVAGLYLVYRNYVSGYVPAAMLLAAAATAAVVPLRLLEGQVWLPVLAEGIDVGLLYVAYQVLSGELMLAAWLLAPEMTSRPVTAPGQIMFGILTGVLATLLSLYTELPIPAYAAVLICNTLTPALDAIRPRVLGQRRWWRKRP